MAAIMLVTVMAAMAQEMPPIPVDKAVRIGKLDNGLTYYIRHNEYPANVANFYIAQRVGSINEDDNQRGLAHFLEHMAFNGSEHFKGNGIIDYTRSLGVQFGGNLNAYTSIDETVYNINDVPATRQSALDSCLLILKDWSNGLLLETEEIDKERGVIHEEWRMRSSAMQRMLERSLPALYPGSKYGYRMPIGLMEVIDNFEPQALRDYYHKWYRPDNQAIVVVGDIDVDHTEAEIKKLFSATVVPANAAQVIAEPVPDNAEAIYVIDKDKEQQYTQILLMIKSDATPKEAKLSLDYLIGKYVEKVVENMVNSRLADMAQEPDCPFIQASADFGNYLLSKTKDALEFRGVPKDGKETETLQLLYKELRRIIQHGFTASEYERAKADYLSAIEKAYTNREKTKSVDYCLQYVRHYLDCEPIPSIEEKYQIMNMIAPNIPVEAINMTLQQGLKDSDENLVVLMLTQEEDGKTYTTTEELKGAIAAARAETIEAFVDNVKDEPLVAELPAKGTITNETENKELGFKELTLSNGAKVIVKKTDYKDDQILMQADAAGGKSLYGKADYSNLKVLDDAIKSSGLGNFSNSELRKALAGKVVSVGAEFGNTRVTLNGQTTPKDIETMMQLTYLYFTKINKDEQSYNSLVNQLKVLLQNQSLNPDAAFSDSIRATMYADKERMKNLNIEDLDKIDYDRMLQIGTEMLSDPGAFTFTFVGNIDEAQLRDLVCQYIAPLPAKKAGTPKVSNVAAYAKGEKTNQFKRQMETPKCTVIEMWYSNAPYTLENSVKADVAGQVLSMFYLQTIREDAGAAYSVGASGAANRILDEQTVMMQAYCPTSPDKVELAMELLKKGMQDAAETTDAGNLNKVKEYLLKQFEDDAKTNKYWLDIIDDYKNYGVDMYTGYKNTVQALTPESISAFVKDVLLKDGNHAKVVMMPE